jgi:hypothetical protein
MDPLLQLQYDLNDKLNSEAFFYYIPVAMLRALVIAQEVSSKLPHLAGKNGRLGLGIIIHMPETRGIDPNVSQPQSEEEPAIDVVENPELNFDPSTGTQITCEECVRAIRRLIQPLSLDGQIFFFDQGAIIQAPIPDVRNLYPGCAGYRLTLKVRLNDVALPAKCAAPRITNSGDNITITTTQAGAATYYTTDGTFPGPSSTGPNNTASTAQVYAAPFAAAGGAYIRAASYLANYTGSDTVSFTAP